jgi:membrane-associated protease RseP (regulator of RpoE activity)
MLPLKALKANASGAQGVYLHPAAIAAWVGVLATALNLLPGGQLDGGHIVFSVAPRKHRWVSRLTICALIPLAIYSCSVWLLWAVILRFTAMRRPMVPEWPDVGRMRLVLAGVALVMLILTFTPAPIAHHSLVDTIRDYRAARQ